MIFEKFSKTFKTFKNLKYQQQYFLTPNQKFSRLDLDPSRLASILNMGPKNGIFILCVCVCHWQNDENFKFW